MWHRWKATGQRRNRDLNADILQREGGPALTGNRLAANQNVCVCVCVLMRETETNCPSYHVGKSAVLL